MKLKNWMALVSATSMLCFATGCYRKPEVHKATAIIIDVYQDEAGVFTAKKEWKTALSFNSERIVICGKLGDKGDEINVWYGYSNEYGFIIKTHQW